MIANHPEREQIRLENVLTALGNPLRLAVVRRLAAGGEHACGTLVHGLSKSTLTHHWRVLRESGVIWQRPCGRESLLSLRRDDIDARFPGLLDVLLNAVENDSTTDESTAKHLPESELLAAKGSV
ncbi:ArsR family transcriptional regulator [Yersinia frederiksenii]|uniref:ArsR/SmtB family transcription factor n=1 Tax=Yersinia frederiksenii TaxID=29484 RepID=UPI0005DF7F01|nr:helix-turn-helix transcriptional regulator [Yersinia frederiksenii]CNB92560.1 ArsR family transcriptional regulator [Yersinia frederiksenii]